MPVLLESSHSPSPECGTPPPAPLRDPFALHYWQGAAPGMEAWEPPHLSRASARVAQGWCVPLRWHRDRSCCCGCTGWLSSGWHCCSHGVPNGWGLWLGEGRAQLLADSCDVPGRSDPLTLVLQGLGLAPASLVACFRQECLSLERCCCGVNHELGSAQLQSVQGEGEDDAATTQSSAGRRGRLEVPDPAEQDSEQCQGRAAVPVLG